MTTIDGAAGSAPAKPSEDRANMRNNLLRGRLASRVLAFGVLAGAIAAAMFLGSPSPAAAQSAPADELFNYPDTVLNGIISAQVSTPLEECRKLCQQRSGCAGVGHSPKNECRLYANVNGGQRDVGSTAQTRSLIPNYSDPTNPPLAARLEKLKATDSDGHELFALSKEAFTRNNRDVGMQAIYLAMQRGNQDAKLDIARWYDPRTFAQDRVDAADANKAGRSYFELALEGNSQAQTLLTSLCQDASDGSSSRANAYGGFLRTTYCEGSINP
ncbi:PAN domain-containing protein [Mesorhizobium sp. M2A.F.Ca.ET.039.01.1.1]|uniref:PAN domain-containing protein n=1 Tax=Mesorhizobium sp. M2A.F.Ca.ET.039.01.1.1 TaxID=2496746 RepID=UPI001AEC835F|nr:PAN domain-containing protein [Mesorhizobium sp. M2A.F.Ca.ET.039.01.1.1]